MYIIIGCSISYFTIFYRFINYFTPILCIFITEILHSIFRLKGSLYLRSIVVTIVFLAISTVLMNRYFSDTSRYVESSRWYNRWYPYESVFTKRLDPTREKLNEAENIHRLIERYKSENN